MCCRLHGSKLCGGYCNLTLTQILATPLIRPVSSTRPAHLMMGCFVYFDSLSVLAEALVKSAGHAPGNVTQTLTIGHLKYTNNCVSATFA